MSGFLFGSTAAHVYFCRKKTKAMHQHFLWTALLCLLFLPSTAQNDRRLQETKVEAARITRTADGAVIVPSATQKQNVTNGYGLISRLQLPDIKVDEVRRSVTSRTQRGNVEIRINGIPSGTTDLLTLDPTLVRNIRFIDNPGVRYGSGTAYVIDIKTRRAASGYTAGLDAGNALTSWSGNETAYGKLNRKNAELALTYDFGYIDTNGTLTRSNTDYILNDGSHYAVERHDNRMRKRDFSNNIELKYNLTDTIGNALQWRFGTDFDHDANNDHQQITITPVVERANQIRNHEKSFSPVADLYINRQLDSARTLTANLVGTHIRTDAYNFNNEGTAYEYLTNGKTWSLKGELVYEQRFKPFTLSLGSLWTWKFTQNNYSGAVSALNNIHNADVYGFAEIKGALTPQLNYATGFGLSYARYRQGPDSYHFFLCRPKASIIYRPSRPWTTQYVFELGQHVSQIAMISNTALRRSSMEWIAGNPDIRPNHVVTHDVIVSYAKRRLYVQLLGEYRHQHHPNMELWTRTADNQFFSSQRNMGAINMLYTTAYISYNILPDHLRATASSGIYRFHNRGESYHHDFTSYSTSGALQAYLKAWTFTAEADNGWRWMEGDKRNKAASTLDFSLSYRHKRGLISLTWSKPFYHDIHLHNTKLTDQYINKQIYVTSRASANRIYLYFTWKIHHGTKFHNIDKKMENKDTQTGIL